MEDIEEYSSEGDAGGCVSLISTVAQQMNVDEPLTSMYIQLG